MDLSTDVQNLHEQFKFLKNRQELNPINCSSSKNRNDLDIIDVNCINFESDENWLCAVECDEEIRVANLHDWLHNLVDDAKTDISQTVRNETKYVDTRTFTRPKRRFVRPSIEKYNEEAYSSVNSDSLHSEPLNLDLTQPTNSYYFENVLAKRTEIDSFQNMSPPSLANSMSSSTFANLMESSFIKNDPVLREISSTDYSGSILLENCEQPMFQSFTESCSSINSDSVMNFLKKSSINCSVENNTKRKSLSEHESIVINNVYDNEATFDLNINSECCQSEINLASKNTAKKKIVDNQSIVTDIESDNINNVYDKEATFNFNQTYRRPAKSETFRKSDMESAVRLLKSALATNLDANSAEISPNSSKTNETLRLSESNKLENSKLMDGLFPEKNVDKGNVSVKRSSWGCSTGSADSLDRMSSLSDSSRESNKASNLPEMDVNAIVEMQERNLRQMVSTPKATGHPPKRLWENNFISPIVASHPQDERLSDSDASSNDEYRSVKSTFSKVSLENYMQPAKSLSHLNAAKGKTNQRSAYTLARQSGPMRAVPSSLRSSYGDLRKGQNGRSDLQTWRAGQPVSNLRNVGKSLRGSYTNLRPTNANLPVAPPVGVDDVNRNLTVTVSQSAVSKYGQRQKVVEVAPMMARQNGSVAGDNTFVKPLVPRASGLPRPTGIPRPASKIPASRFGIARPISSRSSLIRQHTKEDYQ